jgi:hypothetical protein
LSQLEVAHAFNRPDVDTFMDEVNADQWAEWEAYFTLRPIGFRAVTIQTARLAWAAIQPHCRKSLKESDFALHPAGNVHSDAVQRARFEAFAVQVEIREQMQAQLAG